MRAAVGLPPRDGVLVREVEDGSAAAAAGIREGDMIVSAGGKQITEPDDVYDALGTVTPGATLQVSLVRGAEDQTVTVSFGQEQSNEQTNGPVH